QAAVRYLTRLEQENNSFHSSKLLTQCDCLIPSRLAPLAVGLFFGKKKVTNHETKQRTTP
ncbi:hypothetical protein, partial [Escherichia coli]|uniref:hypothetical protein n=1 Tax=Escherichia coli TaxID=562 RepID=UPI003D34BE78